MGKGVWAGLKVEPLFELSTNTVKRRATTVRCQHVTRN